MPATKTRKPKSAFAEATDFGSIIVHRKGAVAPAEDDKGYASTYYTEYVNAERTIAVIGNYRSYAIAVKTNLTPAQVCQEDESILTYVDYAETRARGVWVMVKEDIGAKTRARAAADAFLAKVQDVNNPTVLSLDGSFAPALTIALKGLEEEHEYYRDHKRKEALRHLAEKTGLDLDLLTLAVKEDRIVWSTPPMAPKQVVVVVRETATAALSERLVDEIVLATGEVEGLGRIVHTGSVSQFLLAQRERHQGQAVVEILAARDEVQKTLKAVADRVATLQEEVGKGQIVGRGFHDTLRIGNDAEAAQAAATRYALAVANADLPTDFVVDLCNGTYDGETRYSYGPRSDSRKAIKALQALNGADYDSDSRYY